VVKAFAIAARHPVSFAAKVTLGPRPALVFAPRVKAPKARFTCDHAPPGPAAATGGPHRTRTELATSAIAAPEGPGAVHRADPGTFLGVGL